MTNNKKSQLNDHLFVEWYDKIMEGLERGVAEWVKPWNSGFPCNAITGRPYSGLNVFLLQMVQEKNGWGQARWMTPGSALKMAKARGIRIGFKGQKTTTVRHFCPIFKGEGAERKLVTFKVSYWKLLNVVQIEGLPQDVAEGPKALSEEERNTKAEEFFNKLGADVRDGGDRAFYSPREDWIGMPAFSAFQDAASFYSTLAHEYVHWTGHKSRLGRDLTGTFGSPNYAKEELVAEFGAAFLCGQLGLEGKLQHPEYIGHWLKALRADKSIALQAAGMAAKAARSLLEAGGLIRPYDKED